MHAKKLFVYVWNTAHVILTEETVSKRASLIKLFQVKVYPLE